MRLWCRKGLAGTDFLHYSLSWFWGRFIQEQALLDFASLLSFTSNPQKHFPEPRSADFHTKLSLM